MKEARWAKPSNLSCVLLWIPNHFETSRVFVVAMVEEKERGNLLI